MNFKQKNIFFYVVLLGGLYAFICSYKSYFLGFLLPSNNYLILKTCLLDRFENMYFLFAFLVNKLTHQSIIYNTIKNKLEINTHLITMVLLFSHEDYCSRGLQCLYDEF